MRIKNILVTGGAGFIGSHLQEKLLINYPKAHLYCIDNFDPFYDRAIKEQNLFNVKNNDRFHLLEGDFTNKDWLIDVLKSIKLDLIIHLAAKAGVRSSISNPIEYNKTNVEGLINLLEIAKDKKALKFIYASSSSVYGQNSNVPWSTSDKDLQPISPYAASKIAGENYCKVYNKLYNIPIVALRFFTVYGPRQRPDLAIHKFFKKIDEGTAIDMYGDGSTRRDYTYVDDIILGIIGAIELDKKVYSVYNLGNSETINLTTLIHEIESQVGKKAIINQLPEQAGDVSQTYSSIESSKEDLNFIPLTSINDGLIKFKHWYRTLNE